MNEMLLLGAGASVEAGVSSAYKMTEEIAKALEAKSSQHFLNKHDPSSTISQTLNFIIGGLLFEEAKKGNNPFTIGVNVEDAFNATLLLADRTNLEASPFIGSWDSTVERLDSTDISFTGLGNAFSKFSDAYTKELYKILKSALEHGGRLHSSPQIDVRKLGLEKLGEELQVKSGNGKIFRATAEKMILALKDLVWVIEDKKVEYLKPVLNLLKTQSRVVISTLNYDNTIELMAASQHIHCETGIDEWSKTGRIDLSKDQLYLLKLHGSIDWKKTVARPSHKSPLSQTVISKIPSEKMTEKVDTMNPLFGNRDFQPAVIFGQRNKLTADGPFLDLLRSFQEELSKTTLLTVVGYSFRDSHINLFISQWLNQNLSNRVRIIDPFFKKNKFEFAQALRQAKSLSRDKVEVIEKSAGEALKDLYGDFKSDETGKES